jgi:hypothetical protein
MSTLRGASPLGSADRCVIDIPAVGASTVGLVAKLAPSLALAGAIVPVGPRAASLDAAAVTDPGGLTAMGAPGLAVSTRARSCCAKSPPGRKSAPAPATRSAASDAS